MTEGTYSKLSDLAARLRSLEGVARNRGSLACDRLANQIGDIRVELERVATDMGNPMSPHAEAQPVAWMDASGTIHASKEGAEWSDSPARPLVYGYTTPQSSGGEFRFTPSESDRNRCYNCGLRLADHVPDDNGARCKREAVRQLREITAPPSAPVEVAGSALIDLIEGAGCARWQNEQGFRLKDTPEWVAFYNATRRALAQQPEAASKSG